MEAVLDQIPNDEDPRGGLLDQVEPVYTVHIVERYWWRWEDEPNSDPQYLGQKRLGTVLRVPFPYDVTTRQIRVYMVTATETGIINTTELRNAVQVVYPQAPLFTAAAFDTSGLDIDLVFAKQSTGTGNIQVEYKKVLETTWTTHATTFSHSATSGSITIAQESTAQTYQLRLKQVGFENYSRTLEVTVNGSAGGNAPPTFTSATYDSANNEIDLVFAKNGSGTGNIQVEYKLASDSTWLTHGTEFAHGATSGSVVIAEQPTALTYDLRLKQASVAGSSTTRQVTVDAAPNTPPSNCLADIISSFECEHEVEVTWTAGSGSGLYTVERKPLGGSYAAISTNATSPYTTTMFGLGTNKTYYFRVKQNDVAGYSNESTLLIPKCFI